MIFRHQHLHPFYTIIFICSQLIGYYMTDCSDMSDDDDDDSDSERREERMRSILDADVHDLVRMYSNIKYFNNPQAGSHTCCLPIRVRYLGTESRQVLRLGFLKVAQSKMYFSMTLIHHQLSRTTDDPFRKKNGRKRSTCFLKKSKTT